jgi:hypothetical protein
VFSKLVDTLLFLRAVYREAFFLSLSGRMPPSPDPFPQVKPPVGRGISYISISFLDHGRLPDFEKEWMLPDECKTPTSVGVDAETCCGRSN